MRWVIYSVTLVYKTLLPLNPFKTQIKKKNMENFILILINLNNFKNFSFIQEIQDIFLVFIHPQ